MGILRVLGFGLFLLVIIALMPAVFAEFVKTIIAFLQSSQQALTAAGILASHAALILPPVR